MQAARGLKNPVVVGMLIHGCVFVAILVAVIIGARAAGPNTKALIVVIVVPLTVAMILSVGITSANPKRRERYKQVALLNPSASIVRAEWSSAVLAPFLDDGPTLKGTNYRGFGVEICADAEGLSFWRGSTRREVVSLGTIPWHRVFDIQPGTAKAAIGPRIAETIQVHVETWLGGAYKAHIELLVRDIPARQGVNLLQSRRPT